jgi:hypothetical protein
MQEVFNQDQSHQKTTTIRNVPQRFGMIFNQAILMKIVAILKIPAMICGPSAKFILQTLMTNDNSMRAPDGIVVIRIISVCIVILRKERLSKFVHK